MARTVIDIKTLLDTSGLSAGVQEADGILRGFGKAATVAVAGAATAAGAAFVKGFADAMDREALADRFGGDIVERSASLYRDAWGDSLEDVAAQFAEAQRAFGDDADLEALTAQAFALGERFDRDVGESIQDAKELAESFGIEATHAMDLVAASMESAPAAIRDEISAATREYGGFFASLGLDAERTLSFFVDVGEDGAMALDKAGDAIKELTIRGTDMSTASQAAYEAAGLSAEDYAQRLLAGGEDAKFAMLEIAGALESIEDPVEQANAAIALFGTPLEDLGTAAIPDFLLSLQDMGNDFGDVRGAAQAVADEVGGNTLARLESLKRRGLDALAETVQTHVLPAFNSFLDWGEEHWPVIRDTITSAFGVAADFIREHGPAIRDTIVEAVGAVVAFVETHWPMVQAIITQVVERISALVEEHWPQIREIILTAIEAVRAGIDRVVTIIQGVWERWGDEIKATASRVWSAIEGIIGGALDIIQGIFETFRALFEGDWDAMWEGIQRVLDGALDLLGEAFSLAWDGIQVAAGIAWDALKAGAGRAIDAIVGFVKGLPGRLLGWGVDLYNAARDLFGKLADGLLDALSAVPGMIADKVLGPLDDIVGKVGEIVGAVGDAVGLTGSGDKVRAAEAGAKGFTFTFGLTSDEVAAAAAQEAALLAAAVANNPGRGGSSAVPAFHRGGDVLPSMGGNVPGIGRDEVIAKLKVGETVLPPGASRGPLVGTLIVNDGRSIESELRLIEALHGGPAGMAAA